MPMERPLEYSEVALQRVREDRLLLSALDQWLFEEIEPYLGKRILEIGCGLGNFAGHLTNRELYVGVETEESSVRHVQSAFAAHPNMHALVADVTTDDYLALGQHAFDTAFSLNVFEHIQDDLTAIKHAAALLQPGGRLILVVPAHPWLYGSIDRAIGHYRRYDKQTMAGMFRQAGLDVVKLKYINALGALGWWANGRLRKQQTPPSGQLRLFNVLVPALKRIEHTVPVPFGISLLAVGCKGR